MPYYDNITQEDHWHRTAKKCKPPKQRDAVICLRKQIRTHEFERDCIEKGSPSLQVVSEAHSLKAENHKHSLVETDSVSVQTDIEMSDISSYTDSELKKKDELRRNITVHELTRDKRVKFYTGLTFMQIWFLFHTVRDKAQRMTYWKGETGTNIDTEVVNTGRDRQLNLWQEYLLCIVRLRRGLDVEQLADMFAVSPTTVSRAFTTWIAFLANELPAFLLRWPSREQVMANRPDAFKYFPKTRCIKDATEFFIQRPSLPSSQRKTFSNYKQHNTFKTLVSITPWGYISYISPLWSGNVSDRRLTLHCGFMDHIESQDDVMADRGFCIRDALALKMATLNIPPFTQKGALSRPAVTKTRRIARARIHVERAIGRVKCYKLLSGIIPLKLKDRMDNILVVCACLCNVDKRLVK